MAKKKAPKPKPASPGRAKKGKSTRAAKVTKKAATPKRGTVRKGSKATTSRTPAKKVTAKPKATRPKARSTAKSAKRAAPVARSANERREEQRIHAARRQRNPKVEQDTAVQEPAPEQKQKRSFSQQARAAQQKGQPNELHPGQTGEQGRTHDRPGSQLERTRHLYPNGNRPNSGGARSTQYKGKRRDNMSQGGE